MSVLIDTTIWSLALRRPAPPRSTEAAELAELIREGRALLAGPIRQELLSGVRRAAQFDQLRDHLRAFPDVLIAAGDYEEAAACCNRCRSAGIQGSAVDFLLCALALRDNTPIFTADKDFSQYATVLALKLHEPRT